MTVPNDPGHRPSVEARRRAWGLIPIVFGLLLALAAIVYAVKFDEWSGYVMAAFILAIVYFFGMRDVDRSSGQ